MALSGKTRRKDLDFLKGLAILVVVFYHLGVLESGYLGVDLFFVVAGFLTVPKVLREITDKKFSYFKFIWSRVVRLLPAVLIGSALCLIIGYFLWLPDDYENLSQSIIASTAFSNNLLSAITTKNYWDSINDYKPLMHTWYLGILMEFYIIFPLVTMALNKFSSLIRKNSKTIILWGYSILTVVSFAMFLLPNVSVGDRFYLIPFRFFELMLGGIVGIISLEKPKTEILSKKVTKCISIGSLIAIVALFFIGILTFDFSSIGVESVVIGSETQTGGLLLPNTVLVPLVVLLTAIFLYVRGEEDYFEKTRIIPALGKRSYSIFVWHQIILALYRYSVSSMITVLFLVCFVVVLIVISELSYKFIETKISSKQSIAILICAFLVCGFSGYIYIQAGTMRDVPELGVSVDNVRKGMYAEYCDRIYDYDKDFESTDKLKVLVIGNSFARDFGNILLEYDNGEDVELSYSFDFNENLVGRIQQADRIFVFAQKQNVPDYLWDNAKSEDVVYGIGTKNFGSLNGQIYSKRFNDDYFEQKVPVDPGYEDLNNQLTEQWGKQYIDMMEVVTEDGMIRVFTDDNMYISQDTRHLTQAGARYYVQLLNLDKILY